MSRSNGSRAWLHDPLPRIRGKSEKQAVGPAPMHGGFGGSAAVGEGQQLRHGESAQDRERRVVDKHGAAPGGARREGDESPGNPMTAKLIDDHAPARQATEDCEERSGV